MSPRPIIVRNLLSGLHVNWSLIIGQIEREQWSTQTSRREASEHILRTIVMPSRTRREARLGWLLDRPLWKCSGNAGSRMWQLIVRIWRDGVAIRTRRSLGCWLEELRINWVLSCFYPVTSQLTWFWKFKVRWVGGEFEYYLRCEKDKTQRWNKTDV